MNAISRKNKDVMLDRLTGIFNDCINDNTACLSAIGICMLHMIPTEEEQTKAKKISEELCQELCDALDDVLDDDDYY